MLLFSHFSNMFRNCYAFHLRSNCELITVKELRTNKIPFSAYFSVRKCFQFVTLSFLVINEVSNFSDLVNLNIGTGV